MNKKILKGLLALTVSIVAMIAIVPSAFASTNYFVGPALHHYCGNNWVTIGSDSYVPSNGSQHCNDATWDDHWVTQSANCSVWTYIPFDGFPHSSTATITYGLYGIYGQLLGRVLINQSNYSGRWAYLGSFSGIHHVYIADNDGQTGTMIGASTMEFICG